MKIICTEKQKEELVEILDNNGWGCLDHINCPEGLYCWECIESGIEWEITDENNGCRTDNA